MARSVLGSNFVEVYFCTSLDKVMRRDPMGRYRQVREGKLPGFVGIADEVPYEPPGDTELIIDTENNDEETGAHQLTEILVSILRVSDNQ